MSKKNVITDTHHYNGDAYKKPRRMKPRNMTRDAVDNFLRGNSGMKTTKKRIS